MANDWQPPKGHPITIEEAKTLLAGDLGDIYRDILKTSCVPIFWFDPNQDNGAVLHNGTLTLVRTPQRVLGITAEHVISAYQSDRGNKRVRFQLMNAVVDNLEVIASSKRLDLATIAITDKVLKELGKDVAPLASWPPQAPQDGRAVMLAGYPGIERLEPKTLEVDFGLFTALGVARGVTNEQITWVVERDFAINHQHLTQPPPEYELGGISGGPLIGWFETAGHISHYCLSGIISQAHPNLENVIAKRADFIRDDGTIREIR
jgi:hypothetical protein